MDRNDRSTETRSGSGRGRWPFSLRTLARSLQRQCRLCRREHTDAGTGTRTCAQVFAACPGSRHISSPRYHQVVSVWQLRSISREFCSRLLWARRSQLDHPKGRTSRGALCVSLPVRFLRFPEIFFAPSCKDLAGGNVLVLSHHGLHSCETISRSNKGIGS